MILCLGWCGRWVCGCAHLYYVVPACSVCKPAAGTVVARDVDGDIGGGLSWKGDAIGFCLDSCGGLGRLRGLGKWILKGLRKVWFHRLGQDCGLGCTVAKSKIDVLHQRTTLKE